MQKITPNGIIDKEQLLKHKKDLGLNGDEFLYLLDYIDKKIQKKKYN